ncbi:hypothetical protein DICPUDRAFT_74198 [Dictyostelium purpureum]|uniref:Class II aldolase/adducin N-terminal domain-containing protein n=1 Tax=Dictyostelium purpureum TaxID=5786 RepID=F0Z726_DICPU|nr:uncharacterized protein DICPUDRAFT_74198 [Dictyostelium purpureum]EGC40261.1 hypothetical protein DICPUDRAFT_74198 [Dictyostelium purpureum]|eukprot:XP_003283197.1 hypothetical protein DICPUDRAFT_74198 [Dictyostelium purpureum]
MISNKISDSNEISVENKSKYSDIEYLTRVKLAAAYRLVAHYKWDEVIYNHLTARIPGTDYILLNPFGMRFDEVTASSLVKLDLEGNIIDEGSSNLGINSTGYVIHGAIHRARPDIESTMHTHVNDVVAVACYKEGLLPISQNALIVGDVSYHDYEGISVNLEEQGRIVKSLGSENKCLILRNHGIVTCGNCVEEAFYFLYQLTKACEIQVKMLSIVGGDTSKLTIPSEEIKDFVIKTARSFTKQGNGKKEFKALYRLIETIDDSFKN